MRYIENGAKGLSLLIDLNSDRLIYLGALAAALMMGAYIGSF
ncbi:hypothetical protein [Oceaniglobus indicus]|nr:hypothetical protein [Oceaniglobus indicus]